MHDKNFGFSTLGAGCDISLLVSRFLMKKFLRIFSLLIFNAIVFKRGGLHELVTPEVAFLGVIMVVGGQWI